jgi:hypothetical protein
VTDALIYVVGAMFVSAFLGAFILRAAIHATNVTLLSKRGNPAVPFPSFDWSVTLQLIANVINFVVNWIVTGFVIDLATGLRDDKEFAQLLGILIAFPVTVFVGVLVLWAGLSTTLLRACLVVFFEFVFSLLFAIAVAAIALVVVLIAWAIGARDKQTISITGIIVGVIGAVTGFAACLNKLEGTGDRSARDKLAPAPTPAPVPVAPPPAPQRQAAEVWQGTADGRGVRMLVAFLIMVIVIGVLLILLPRLAG